MDPLLQNNLSLREIKTRRIMSGKKRFVLEQIKTPNELYLCSFFHIYHLNKHVIRIHKNIHRNFNLGIPKYFPRKVTKDICTSCYNFIIS